MHSLFTTWVPPYPAWCAGREVRTVPSRRTDASADLSRDGTVHGGWGRGASRGRVSSNDSLAWPSLAPVKRHSIHSALPRCACHSVHCPLAESPRQVQPASSVGCIAGDCTPCLASPVCSFRPAISIVDRDRDSRRHRASREAKVDSIKIKSEPASEGLFFSLQKKGPEPIRDRTTIHHITSTIEPWRRSLAHGRPLSPTSMVEEAPAARTTDNEATSPYLVWTLYIQHAMPTISMLTDVRQHGYPAVVARSRPGNLVQGTRVRRRMAVTSQNPTGWSSRRVRSGRLPACLLSRLSASHRVQAAERPRTRWLDGRPCDDQLPPLTRNSRTTGGRRRPSLAAIILPRVPWRSGAGSSASIHPTVLLTRRSRGTAQSS